MTGKIGSYVLTAAISLGIGTKLGQKLEEINPIVHTYEVDNSEITERKRSFFLQTDFGDYHVNKATGEITRRAQTMSFRYGAADLSRKATASEAARVESLLSKVQ